jgi:hypothetical protein
MTEKSSDHIKNVNKSEFTFAFCYWVIAEAHLILNPSTDLSFNYSYTAQSILTKNTNFFILGVHVIRPVHRFNVILCQTM